MDEQRLDKWLWCTRFFKTRGLAAKSIKSGRVTVNGTRAKPARMIHTEDLVVLKRPPYEFRLNVVGISKQRLSAGALGSLYLEQEQSLTKRTELAQSIKASAVTENRQGGKLSKKDRRDREKIKRLLSGP